MKNKVNNLNIIQKKLISNKKNKNNENKFKRETQSKENQEEQEHIFSLSNISGGIKNLEENIQKKQLKVDSLFR